MGEDGAGTKPASTGLGMAGIIVAGLIVAGVYLGTGSEEATGPEEPDAVSRPAVSQPVASDAPAETAQVGNLKEPTVLSNDTAAGIAPRIDEVRLEADGLTVIAGRAAPGATVSVLVDGVEIAQALADPRGAFASVVFIDPSEAARILTLKADSPSGAKIASAEDIILAPIARSQAQAEPSADTASDSDTAATSPAPQERTATTETAVAETANAAPTPTASESSEDPATASAVDSASSVAVTSVPPASDDVLALSSGVTASAPKPEAGIPATSVAENNVTPLPESAAAPLQNDPLTVAGASPATVAPEPTPRQQAEPEAVDQDTTTPPVAVLRSTAEGVALLQTDAAPVLSIGIDTIGYSDEGDVELTGRALPGSFEARVYLDNRFVSSLEVDTGGTWRGTVPDVDEGIYTLRVDEVNAVGDVTSRLETPFRREDPDALARAGAGQDGPVTAITVQTGDTLWAIARDRYGEGTLFVRVFEANSATIRNPDLIYPGQVFDLPID